MNPIIKHLANIKFYADSKRSPARSFDQYVEYIDSGAPEDFKWSKAEGFPVIDKYDFEDPFLGEVVDSKTEKAVEDFIEHQRQDENIPKLNLDDWYKNVEIEIIFRFKRYGTELIKRKSPFETLKELVNQHELIKELISISVEDFYTYTSLMQGKSPEDFITIFSKKNKVEDYPLINCFPRIFINCKSYAFFLEQENEIENPAADYSFIFYQMREDKLIHFYCKDDYLELVNQGLKSVIEIYPESKVKNSKFKYKYSQIYQNMF